MRDIAIITGISGQDGAFLADLLFKKNYKIVGLAPVITNKELWRLEYLGVKDKLIIIRGDVTDNNLIGRLLKRYQPDEFYNLAGQSSVAKSWEEQELTFKINSISVVNILRLIKKYSPHTKFFQCSSAEMYGDSREVITENGLRFKPLNPYGKSKLLAYLAVKKFREEHGLFACNGILFNHESPFKNDFAVSKKIIRGVARIVVGLDKKIVLGNLNAKRDWGYAGDFVRAMWLVLQQKEPSDFVICTGRSNSIKEFLAETFKQVGVKKWRQFVKIDKGLFRRAEVKNMRGCPRKAVKILGWKPKINFKQLIKLMLDYEFEHI